ncbi:Lipoprotein-releasing system ATP-binding protein LolD [Clostridioides difficile]|nr:Lipoprotein-releasing system ATP-binding protein LolD [Clostridioides difficile]
MIKGETMGIITLHDVKKSYAKGNIKVEALKGINLEVEKGEFIALVGPSGSGKSTLLQILGGLDSPTNGQIIVDNININELKDNALSAYRRDKVGFIFQFFNLIECFNVEENITFPIRMGHKKVDEDYKNEIIDILGLRERMKHFPSELSGGQQQRVAIGRALLNKPSIILADEPTGNLDSKNSKEVIELLKCTAKKYFQTIIIVTHDLKIAETADRVLTMKDGEIINDEVKYK